MKLCSIHYALRWNTDLKKTPFGQNKRYKKCHLFSFASSNSSQFDTAWKVSKYVVFSGPYFPAFGLNTKRYGVSLRIQSECGKIQNRKSSVFGHFSCSVTFNLRLLYELRLKVRLSKTVCRSFHFRFRFAFIKVYIFVLQNAKTLWL